MKENKSAFIIFAVLFGSVLALLLTTEKHSSQIELPGQSFINIDINNHDENEKSEALNIFDKETMIEFASEMFENNGVRSGTNNVDITGFTKEELGIDSSIINYTEVVLAGGSKISFVEPEAEAVNMYNNISVNNLIAVILVDNSGEKKIIKPGDENFETYRLELLKEKRIIQTTKLTNLEMLLAEANFVGGYDAYLINEENVYSKIRTAKLYYNEKKNYMLMLSRNKLGVEYFLVDAGVDLYFDHIYEIGSEFLDVKGFVTADNLEHKIYRTFMQMIDLDQHSFETNFMGVKLLIIKKE